MENGYMVGGTLCLLHFYQINSFLHAS